ncbi:hypothetical protein CRENBAI_020998 [Crenichthys baileyi]|uniref:Uncharacterized protein n=1 Tax=Crenichthys baileyi TaxID=28760 RepID=A0AAV9QX87_9TELE
MLDCFCYTSGNQAYSFSVPAFVDVPCLPSVISSPGNQFLSSCSVFGFQYSASSLSDVFLKNSPQDSLHESLNHFAGCSSGCSRGSYYPLFNNALLLTCLSLF